MVGLQNPCSGAATLGGAGQVHQLGSGARKVARQVTSGDFGPRTGEGSQCTAYGLAPQAATCGDEASAGPANRVPFLRGTLVLKLSEGSDAYP